VKEISDIITSGGIESSDPAKTGHLSEKEYDVLLGVEIQNSSTQFFKSKQLTMIFW
jgi:hypothetical protein